MERMALAAEADRGQRHILKNRLSEAVFFAPRMRRFHLYCLGRLRLQTQHEQHH